MAGTKRKDVSVKLKGSLLNVTYTTRLGESRSLTYSLSDKWYEQEQLSCTYEDGLLTVKAPLKKEQPPVPPQDPETEIEIK